MNKVLIPALLVATIMVAGAFAFMPVEQASTVHTTAAFTISTAQTALIADEMLEVREITATNLVFGDGTVAIQIEGADAADRFELLSLIMSPGTVGAGGNNDDLIIDEVSVDGAFVAHTDSADIDIGTGNTPVELTSKMDLVTTLAGNVILFELTNGVGSTLSAGDTLDFVAQVLIRDSAGNPVITIE